jgi:hypothetical protein
MQPKPPPKRRAAPTRHSSRVSWRGRGGTDPNV